MSKQKLTTKDRRLWRVAYHEAGHAVAAFWLHRPIHKVTIMGDENSSGKVVRKRRPNTINPRKWFNETGYRIQADIIILYAGQLAQERFAPGSLRPGDMSWQGRGDDDQMVDLALLITDTDGVTLLLQYLKHEAEWLINHFWDDIVTVAKALLKQKTLTGDQVRDVIHQHHDRLIQPHVRRLMKSYRQQAEPPP